MKKNKLKKIIYQIAKYPTLKKMPMLGIIWINRKIGNILIKLILKTKNFKSSDSIIIFSEARGGSTWLMEMLSDTLDICINWEPLHVDNGVLPIELNFGWRPFIPKEQVNESYISIFKKIHEYKIHSRWTRKYLSLKKLIKSKHVLIKYVRANLLVPYLIKNFEFKYVPIFLIRHPIDTCLSQIKTFENHDNNLFKAIVPNCINNERFIKHKDFFNQLDSKLELKVATWCLNNCTTLEQISEYNNLHIIFYSDLLLSPKKELEDYLNKYKLSDYIKNLNQVDFKKASSTDFKKEYCSTVEKQLSKNFEALDNQTKDKIQKIFDYFEFKLYSAYSPFPNKQHLTPHK